MDKLKPQVGCKHLRAYARGLDIIGQMYCPDCHRSVPIYIPFNNLMAEMRRIIRGYKAAKTKKTTIKVPRTEQSAYSGGTCLSAKAKPQKNAGKKNSRAGNRKTKKDRK